MWNRILNFMLPIGCILVACQPVESVLPTANVAVESTLAAPAAAQPLPTLEPAADVTAVASPDPASTPVPEEVSVPAQDGVSISPAEVAGLVFDMGELVKVAPDGTLISLYTRPVDILSANGRYALTSGYGDYWMYDLLTGNLVKLNDTSTREECCATWWTVHDDEVLMLSAVAGASVGVGSQGYLTVIGVDGTGYRVLDADHPSAGTPAVSPDGTWIAYGMGETGWLFGGELGPLPFDPADYGLVSLKGQQISHPAWSPDGTKIAWYWQGTLNVGPRRGVVIFDLVNRTYQMSALVEPGTEYLPAASPLWSPDGKWLAYLLEAKDAGDTGAWVMQADGAADLVVHLGTGALLPGAWSPDGMKLALSGRSGTDAPEGIWLARTADWSLSPVDLLVIYGGKIFQWQ